MEIFAQRLRERAERLGISNAEAARRIGLEERRYAHYVAGRREPDLATVKRIAERLLTTPDWLLGFGKFTKSNSDRNALIERLTSAATGMNRQQLEMVVIQAEAVAASNSKQ